MRSALAQDNRIQSDLPSQVYPQDSKFMKLPWYEFEPNAQPNIPVMDNDKTCQVDHLLKLA